MRKLKRSPPSPPLFLNLRCTSYTTSVVYLLVCSTAANFPDPSVYIRSVPRIVAFPPDPPRVICHVTRAAPLRESSDIRHSSSTPQEDEDL